MSTSIELRPATAEDLEAIERLETVSFGTPWARDAYLQELERDVAYVEVSIDPAESLVIGMACTWYVEDEAHVMRIAIHPAYRRRGVGRRLLQSALQRAAQVGCVRTTLEVASQNLEAIALYRSAGFEVVGIRHRYYSSPPDDALVMQVRTPSFGRGPRGQPSR